MEHVTALDERHMGLLTILVLLWIVFYAMGREAGTVAIVGAALLAVILAIVNPWLGLGAVQWVIAAAIGARR